MRSARIVLLTAAAGGALAAPAGAATLKFGYHATPFEDSGSSPAIFYEGEPGEANDVVVRVGRLGHVQVSDPGAVIRFVPGTVHAACVPAGRHNMACRVLGGPPDIAALHGADGDDRLTVEGPLFAFLHGEAGDDVLLPGTGTYNRLLGGEGDDTLTGGYAATPSHTRTNDMDGGPGDDVLDGGPDSSTMAGGDGADLIRGGPGDHVGYGKPVAVHVTLDGVANDGTPGEGDNVLPGVGQVSGTEFADVLVGSAGGETLYGSRGDDTIDGGAGDDTVSGGLEGDDLTGGPGADRLIGNSGDDVLRSADGEADELFCFSGADVVFADPLDGPLDGCESVEIG